MFKKAFESVRDMNYIKVTKENWARIENLFETKEKTINTQAARLELLEAEVLELRRYKANDDMVYSYEQSATKHRQENTRLKAELKEVHSTIKRADKKVQAVLSLESAYLQRIIQSESKARYCPQYETKGDSLVEFYA